MGWVLLISIWSLEVTLAFLEVAVKGLADNALVGYLGVMMILICTFEPIIMRKDTRQLSMTQRWEERESQVPGPPGKGRGHE